MKKDWLAVILFLGMVPSFLYAQSDTITSRNDIEFRYTITHVLIPEFERTLNFIADKTTSPNEVDDLIRIKVKGSRESRIFFNDKVTIENDLKPGADTNKVLRSDMDVIQYLNTFNTGYSKTEEKNISISLQKISPLKKADYYYYNVLLECNYFGTNSSGEKFTPFLRVAEIKMVMDSGWHSYINSIYFSKGTETDSSNAYLDIQKTETDVDKIIKAYDDEAQRKKREENSRMQVLIEDGDDLFADGKFQDAIAKYREARKINVFNKVPLEKISKARDGIAKQTQERQAKEDRQKHINEMKDQASRARKNYNFKLSKVLCDSLIKDYQVSDPSIDSLNEQMSEINASLTGIETAMEQKNIKNAILICETKIREGKTRNSFYQAEMNYRMARVYFDLDKSESKKIFEYTGQAIELSGRRHQEALKMRALMYLKTGDPNDISHAVEDATYLINNDSRNPELYGFRAQVYEKGNSTSKAIEDYASAILYKTTDSTLFLKKAILEYKSGLYKDVVKTTSDGISKTQCYAILYYYRIISKEKLLDYAGAGDDFRKARVCGLGAVEEKVVRDLSSGYSNAGLAAFNQSRFAAAEAEYTKAVLLDSSFTALYMRARCALNTGKNEQAITDLSALIAKNEPYRDAYNQRGIAYSNIGKFKEADADFDFEISQFKDNAMAHYARGSSLMQQKIYDGAAASFLESATLLFSDSSFYWASYCYYKDKKYSKAIECSNMARKKDTRKYEVYYICGRAFYDIGKFNEAISEFERAKKLVNYLDDLYWWHAVALESNKSFSDASGAYDQLAGSKDFKDTAIYRSAICLMKTRKSDNFPVAVNKFLKYTVSDNNTDKSESNAWAAYASISVGDLDKASQYIESARKSNEENPMLQFALACQHAKNNRYEEALNCLDKAVPLLSFTKDDYEAEPLLKELRKNKASKDRYTQVMEKQFK